MLLIRARVGPFKSIEHPTDVAIDAKVTVLVGMNEAGKTAFLHALHKARSVDDSDRFDPVSDYPRRALTAYLRQHQGGAPDVAIRLTYQLNDAEVQEINSACETELPHKFEFSVEHSYANTQVISIAIDEAPALKALVGRSSLSADAMTAAASASGLRDLAKRLESIERTEGDQEFFLALQARLSNVPTAWTKVVEHEVWHTHLSPAIPKFLYFDDYHLLPGKVNLADLANRVAQSRSTPSALEPSHRGVLALLRMAEIGMADLGNPDGYETIKAKLEGISNSITDQVFRFWRQNENLEVEFDIRADAKETAPFDNGPNVYLRIRNKRHRVTVPFDQRSKGFIWFFSFLVWFDSIQQQVRVEKGGPPELVLLLDEPGLSLHALAQADFLDYIEGLAGEHQVLYSTHSPFMVRSDELTRVRIVEDRDSAGTVVSDDISGSSTRSLFPLQAALGYAVAQNLFISKRNLLVEGPADLIYLQFVSQLLESMGQEGLRDDVTVVPTGGLDKVATFVALSGANEFELVVLHDSTGKADPRSSDLARYERLPHKAVLTYGEALAPAPAKKGTRQPPASSAGIAAGIEDLFMVSEYLELFNGAFAAALAKPIIESELPPGDRIIERITRYLKTEAIMLRPSGGFNSYSVAAWLASHPLATLDKATATRFGKLIKRINRLYTRADTARDDE